MFNTLAIVSSVLSFSYFCLAEPLADVDQLKELLSNPDKDTSYGNLQSPPEPITDDSLFQLKLALRDILQGYFSKTPKPSIRKRVFCNGFFGCGNGKRSYGRQQRQREDDVLFHSEDPMKQKRLFCNSNGCGNFGKRSLMESLIERLSKSENGVNPLSDQELVEDISELLRELRESETGILPKENDFILVDNGDEAQSDEYIPTLSKRIVCSNFGRCGKRNGDVTNQDISKLRYAIKELFELICSDSNICSNDMIENVKRLLFSPFSKPNRKRYFLPYEHQPTHLDNLSVKNRLPLFAFPRAIKRAPGFLFPGRSISRRAPGFLFPHQRIKKRALGDGQSVVKRAPGFLFPGRKHGKRELEYTHADNSLEKRLPGVLFQGRGMGKRDHGYSFPGHILDKRAPGFLFPGRNPGKREVQYTHADNTIEKRRPGFLFPGRRMRKRKPGFSFTGKSKKKPHPSDFSFDRYSNRLSLDNSEQLSGNNVLGNKRQSELPSVELLPEAQFSSNAVSEPAFANDDEKNGKRMVLSNYRNFGKKSLENMINSFPHRQHLGKIDKNQKRLICSKLGIYCDDKEPKGAFGKTLLEPILCTTEDCKIKRYSSENLLDLDSGDNENHSISKRMIDLLKMSLDKNYFISKMEMSKTTDEEPTDIDPGMSQPEGAVYLDDGVSAYQAKFDGTAENHDISNGDLGYAGYTSASNENDLDMDTFAYEVKIRKQNKKQCGNNQCKCTGICTSPSPKK